MYSVDSIKEAIEKGLKGAIAEVKNPRNDNKHFEAEVIFDGFEGKSLIEQHRMVYDTIKDEFKEGMHALKLKTRIK